MNGRHCFSQTCNSAAGLALVIAAVLSTSAVAADPARTKPNERDWRAPATFKELKFQNSVPQIFDFTCGGASLATVLKHYWGRNTNEMQVLSVFQVRYPDPNAWKAKIRDGFSFDDIEFAAIAFGFKAQGAKIEVDQLKAIEGPVIVHLDKGNFQHFSVLRKMTNDFAYLSDPIKGSFAMPADEFKTQYSGSAMAIWKDGRKLPKFSGLAVVRSGVSTKNDTAQFNPPPLAVYGPPLF